MRSHKITLRFSTKCNIAEIRYLVPHHTAPLQFEHLKFKQAMDRKQEHSRDPPFIPPPEQSMFERVSPQIQVFDERSSQEKTLAQESNVDAERTHPDSDTVETWHLGSDVPTVLERSQRRDSDKTSKS